MQQRTLCDITVLNNDDLMMMTTRFAGGERVEQIEQVV